MLMLVFIGLPLAGAVYTFLLVQYRRLVLWAAVLILLLEVYLCARLPLEKPLRLLGATLEITPTDRLLLYGLFLVTAAVLLVAQSLSQGDLPVPIGLFILGLSNAIILLDDPIVIALLLEVAGLAVVLGTVDRPQGPVGLLPASTLMAGLKYLTMMILSGLPLVIGFLLLGRYLEMPQEVFWARLSFGLIVVGFGLSLAAIPFHLWFPDLAGHTSTAVLGLLVALVQGAALAFLGSFFFDFPDLLAKLGAARTYLMVGAVAAAVGAALLAAGQSRWKRLAAYAASFEIALILYALAQGNAAGLANAFWMMLHRLVALVLLLVCVGTLEWSTGRDDLAGLVGIGHRLPVVAAGLLAATLSLAGIPPLGGFVGRWTLFGLALEQGWGYLAGLVVATALFLLAMVRALWPTLLATGQTVEWRPPPRAVLGVIALLIVVLLLLGLYPRPALEVLQSATAVPLEGP